MSPTQIRHAYGFDQLTLPGTATPADGTGETIAIVDAYSDPSVRTDLQAFDQQFGLADPSASAFTIMSQTGSTTNLPGVDPNGPGGSSWELEISLDVELVHALAPGANILLVEANSSGAGDLLTAVNTARQQTGVVVVSMSFGYGEFSNDTATDSTFTTPSGHPGETFVAATGDSGQPGFYPAFSPNVLAVGGTTLSVDANGNRVPQPGDGGTGESGWSGSGGGISTLEPQPSYQNGVVTQFSSTQRTIPDVAFDANPNTGVSIYDSYDFGTTNPWVKVGGTSLSAPAWGTLIAIADQGRASIGVASLDGPTQTLPTIYSLSSNDFNDIITGNNGFAAGPGYDLVTGLGTPKAVPLVNDLIGSFHVSLSNPAVGSVVAIAPTDFAITFSSPYATSGIVASDLTVNGIAADSFALTNSTTITFHFNASPVTSQGLQTMSMAAGTLARQADGSPLTAFGGTFRYDVLPIAIDATTPANNSIVALPLTSLIVHFNEAYAAATIGTSNLTLSQGSVTGFSLIDSQTVQYALSGINNPGTLSIGMVTGAVTDTFGNPGPAYSGNLLLNGGPTAFPTPLAQVSPAGSLIYQNSLNGSVLFAGNTVPYTLAVAAGQTLSIVVTPAPGLQPQIVLAGPGVSTSASSSAAGTPVILQTVPINASGTYTFTVNGANGTTGNYTIEALLNAAISTATSGGASNHTLATAQSIDSSFVGLVGPAQRAAVVGPAGVLVGPNNFGYSAVAVTQQFDDISTTGTMISFATPTTNLSFPLGPVSPTGISFPFFGTTFNAVDVNVHGVITMSRGGVNGSNSNLSASPGPATIAPLWDNIVIGGSAQSAGYYKLESTSSSSRLVIEWSHVSFVGGPQTGQVTFEAILNSDGSIFFNYLNFNTSLLPPGNLGPTVGIKNSNTAGADPLVVPNTSGSSPIVTSGSSIEIAPNIASSPNDYYAFSLAAGQSATLAVTSQNSAAVHVTLLDSQGNTLAAGASPGAGAIVNEAIANFAAATSGTYYALITGAPGAAYSLVVTRSAALGLGNNTSFAAAQDISGDKGALGDILTSTTENWYSINLPAASGLYLQTYTPGGHSSQFVNSLAPLIQLYSPADVLLASGQGTGNQTLGQQISTAGTYRVRVLSANSTSGEYFLDSIVETAPPSASISAVSPSPRNGSVSQVQIVFSEPVGGISLSALSLTDNGGPNLLTSSQTLTTIDNTTFTLGNLSSLTGANGTYTLTLAANGSGIADFAGDPLASDASTSFAVNTTAPQVTAVFASGGSNWSQSFYAYLAANGLGDTQLGYRLLGGTGQLLPLPWNNITTLSVVFSQDVNINAAGLALVGSPDLPAPAALASAAFSYNSGTRTAQWTFAAPLTVDKYLLDIPSAAVANTLGTSLDGEWTTGTSSFPSGDGSPGGDFNFRFNLLPGDTDQNGVVTGVDGNGVRSRLLQDTTTASYTPMFDLNGDGTITGQDGGIVRAQLLQALPADDPSPPGQGFALLGPEAGAQRPRISDQGSGGGIAASAQGQTVTVGLFAPTSPMAPISPVKAKSEPTTATTSTPQAEASPPSPASTVALPRATRGMRAASLADLHDSIFEEFELIAASGHRSILR
ncbi:MAG TPA: dockerin type I domain-containing protein [Pirellulales bacterium]|nr:dockerin type I domain-containing protein [Pirellulales bacterium]